MRPPKYPLEPLAALRGAMVEVALGKLGAARIASDAAERQRLDLERASRARAQSAEQLRRAELEALAAGGLHVADMVRTAAWESAVEVQRRAVASDVSRARSDEANARAAEERAAAEVAFRKADAKVVENDRARWHEALRKRADAREEEAALEASPRTKS